MQTWADAPFYYYNPTATMIRFRPKGSKSAETLPVAPTRITCMTTLFGKIQCCGTMTHNAHHPADM